jgi:hypothetical protein
MVLAELLRRSRRARNTSSSRAFAFLSMSRLKSLLRNVRETSSYRVITVRPSGVTNAGDWARSRS